jgi:hypothetical protein
MKRSVLKEILLSCSVLCYTPQNRSGNDFGISGSTSQKKDVELVVNRCVLQGYLISGDFVVLFCTLLRRSVEHYHQEPNMFEHIVHLQSLHINWGATEVGQPPHA